MAAGENETAQAANLRGGDGLDVGRDTHDHGYGNATARESQTAARAAIGALLAGKPPNGTDPAQLGRWASYWQQLAEVADVDSRRRIFDTLARSDPSLARLMAGDGEEEHPPHKFTPIPADALDTLPPVSWHIEGEIPQHGFGALFGPTGSGKSFFILDRALILAQSAPVVYVAAEGAGGYAARKLAWCKHHGQAAGQLYFVGAAVNMCEGGDVTAFIEAIQPLSPALVILDTLARCMVGYDENSARDMGQFVAGCDRVRSATGASVLVVHHTGKAQNGVERGSSALRAACDFMLGLTNDDGAITLACEKLKDATPFDPRGLRLVTVETGRTLPDGSPETSCVILPGDKVELRGTLTATGRRVLEMLNNDIFIEPGAKSQQILSALQLKESTLYYVLGALKRDGFVRQDQRGNPFYITEEGIKQIGG